MLGLIQRYENITYKRIRGLENQLRMLRRRTKPDHASSVAPAGARARLSSALVDAIIGLLLGVLASLTGLSRSPAANGL